MSHQSRPQYRVQGDSPPEPTVRQLNSLLREALTANAKPSKLRRQLRQFHPGGIHLFHSLAVLRRQAQRQTRSDPPSDQNRR